MTSGAAMLQGSQLPRVEALPDGETHPDTLAALELVDAAGLTLDPWQRHVFERSLRVRSGRWAAFEVGLVIPRQNGKNHLLEARELAGLFVLGERLIIHSAHLFDTSLEAFRRLLERVEENPWLEREVQRVSRSHGEEGLELKTGARIRFRTRTKGGGRGFSGDCVILDEAMDLPEENIAAILPVVSAKSITGNPQVWYTGSAVDQTVHEHGTALARLRERGLRGGDESLAYFEWSLDYDNPADIPPSVGSEDSSWARSNPSLGIRISSEHVANEQRSMDPRTFAVERLGVGDWPVAGESSVIPMEDWVALVEMASGIVGRPALSFDVSPNRATASVSACGVNAAGLPHVETLRSAKGTEWLPEYVAEKAKKHGALTVVCDDSGPAGSLLGELQQLDVSVTTVTAREHSQACGMFYDAVVQKRLRHRGEPRITSALRAATKRQLGDSWAWSRRTSVGDITPLVAATLALWGANQAQPDIWISDW